MVRGHLPFGKNLKTELRQMSGVSPGYEQFWSGRQQASYQDRPMSDLESAQIPSRASSPELTDGQISVALDSDLLSLIDNITQENSRTSTTTTTQTYTTSSDPSFFGGDMLESDSSAQLGFRQSKSFDQKFSFSPRSSSTGYRKNSNMNLLEPMNEDSEASSSSPGAYRYQAPFGVRPPTIMSRATSVGSDVKPLPQVLHALDNESDDCIVVVRRITRLGFKSNRIIKSRFEQMGWDVKNVVLLPSRSRPINSGNTAPVARPSSMGFVVFGTARSAADCLAKGSVTVDGVDVLIQPFSRQYKPSSDIQPRESS